MKDTPLVGVIALIAWLVRAGAIVNFVSESVLIGFKTGVALVHYPLAYLCQCRDIQEALDFAEAEKVHRDLTGQRLNLQLSTRASQASVDVLRASVAALDSDVAKVEAKLDTLGATTARELFGGRTQFAN